LGEADVAGDLNFDGALVEEFGDSVSFILPSLRVNESGHISEIVNHPVTIKIPEYNDEHLMKKDGSNYVGDMNLVSQYITPKWTIKNQSGVQQLTSRTTALTVEIGAKVDFSGMWSYDDKSLTTKLPTSCSGSWGTELIGAGKTKTISDTNLTSTKTYTQTIYAPKSGLEVVNNKVVKATGVDDNKITASVTFLPRIYYGVSTNLYENMIEFGVSKDNFKPIYNTDNTLVLGYQIIPISSSFISSPSKNKGTKQNKWNVLVKFV
jgi:hypothetical protein